MAKKKTATRAKEKISPRIPPSSPPSPSAVSGGTIKIVNKRILKDLECNETDDKETDSEANNLVQASFVADSLESVESGEEGTGGESANPPTHLSIIENSQRNSKFAAPPIQERIVDSAPKGTNCGGGPPHVLKPKSSYREALAGNRMVANGKRLSYVEGIVDGVIPFTKKDIQKTTAQWKLSLIGMVLGAEISLNVMRSFVATRWGEITAPKIILNDSGVFVFKFVEEKDLLWVLERGPWLIGGIKPIALTRWSEGVKLDASCFACTQVWANFPDLDVRFWDEDFFEKMGSAIGKPIYIDKVTANQERLSFARILVEVTANAPLRNEIIFLGEDGERVVQSVTYEWLPARCEK